MKEKANILIVDDNISLIRTMSFILKRKGYSVMLASDGREAIKKVKCRFFDIAFIDIRLPAMNGVEVYKKIKEIRPEAVVIMMTAYTVEDMVQEALSVGAYGVIYKPLEMKETLNLIDEIWKRKQTR